MNNKKFRDKEYSVRTVKDIKEMIRYAGRNYRDKAAYMVKDMPGKDYRPITFGELRRDVDALGSQLCDMGLTGKKIAIIGSASYNWLLTYFATICGVGIIVPLDRNLPPIEIRNLVERSGATALVFDKGTEANVTELMENPGSLEYFISMSREKSEDEILSITELVEKGRKLIKDGDRKYVDADIDAEAISVLLFTSGTTGRSKGVMISHKNLVSNVINMSRYVKVPDGEIVLSILPVHHVYEMTCTYLTCLYQCATVAMCEGFKYIQKNLSELKAGIILGVPLIFEKMYRSIWRKAERQEESDKLRKAIDLSRRLGLYKQPMVVKRMFKPIHQILGDNIHLLIAGGAASDPKIIEDFEAMGLPMIQGYGMTECSPIIAVNKDRYSKAASVGMPLPGHEVKIIEEDEFGVGEVIVKGPSVMLGYFNDKAATDEVLRNGWLYTGDYGYFDEEGFLYITGRKKNVIVTKGGKNIFPEEVEQLIGENPLVEEVMVHGVNDERIGNVAITADLYPNYELLREQYGELTESEIYHLFKEFMDTLNHDLPQYKNVKRINIRKEAFDKTTTGKVKRYMVKSGSAINSSDINGVNGKKRIENIALDKVKELQIAADPLIRYRDSRPITSIKQMLETSVVKYGDNIAFLQKFDPRQPYGEVTYREAMTDINALGTALINSGLKGEKIAIMGENSYQWAVGYLAAVCGAGVAVPIDKDLGKETIKKRLKKAEVKAVIVQEKYRKIYEEIKESGDTDLEEIISFDKYTRGHDKLSQLIDEGKAQLARGDRQFLDVRIDPEALAVLIFTAGTDGDAKGVMLSNANIVDNLMSTPTLIKVNTWDIEFSVLPLHHPYECNCGLLVMLYKGGAVAFCQGIKHMKNNMQEVRPTMFLVVPAILEAIYRQIWREAEKTGKAGKLRRVLKMNKYSDKLGINLVRRFTQHVHDFFGGSLRIIISDGAAINPDILDFFNAVGIVAIQGYGVTECSPMIAVNPDLSKDAISRSAGHVVPGYSVAIRNKDANGIGEIWVRGRSVMKGYYKAPQETAEAVVDGWFNTGDLGYLKDNFIYLIGRKNNMLLTKNGDNVFPEELEALINGLPIVEESMVWEIEPFDSGNILIGATIKVDEEVIADKLGLDYSEDDIKKLIWEQVEQINEALPFYKKIKKVIIRKAPFVKNTANKIVRHVESNRAEK